MKTVVLIQKGDSSTHWTSLYLEGLKNGAKQSGYELESMECSSDLSGIDLSDEDIIIAIGSSYSWMSELCYNLHKNGTKAVLLGYSRENKIIAEGYSTADYTGGMKTLVEYSISNGKKKIALFGVNSDSPTDYIKQKVFLENQQLSASESDVFTFEGNSLELCDRFIKEIDNYDSIICVNDVIAFILYKRITAYDIRYAGNFFVSAFGDVTYRKNSLSPITVAGISCVNMGYNSLKIFKRLKSTGNISYITIKDSCVLDIRSSTGNKPYCPAPIKKPEIKTRAGNGGIFGDETINKIITSEKLLADCDSLDIDIIYELLKKTPTDIIAEKLYTSESTVKYRIKNMLKCVGLEKKSQLIEFILPYLK